MSEKPRTPACLALDDMREDECVGSREARMIGNDDRPTLARNVLEPFDLDSEVTAKELEPESVESLEAAVFDEFYQIHFSIVAGHRATEKPLLTY